MKVGVVGLGIMGMAYATNLARAAFEVTGYDIADDRMEMLGEVGGVAVESPAAVAAFSDVLITSLPSDQALSRVVAGDDGLLRGAKPGLVVIETSTLALEAKLAARESLGQIGAGMVDSPVSGTGLQAAAADVVIYASGDPADLDRVAPIFETLGKTTVRLGAFGNGTKMKLLANLLVSVHTLAAAEALVLGMKSGFEPQQILDALSVGAGHSRMLEIRGPMMVSGKYQPAAARLAMFIKDLNLISDFAAQAGSPVPLLDATRPLYEEAVEAGLGELDAAALCALLEEQAGIDR